MYDLGLLKDFPLKSKSGFISAFLDIKLEIFLLTWDKTKWWRRNLFELISLVENLIKRCYKPHCTNLVNNMFGTKISLGRDKFEFGVNYDVALVMPSW